MGSWKDWKVVHPARAGERAMTAEDLWRVPRVAGVEPTPDGRHVVTTVTTYDLETNEGTSRLWLVDLAQDGAAAPRALTAPGASSSRPAVSPCGTRLAFLRKEGEGDKKRAQVYVMPLDGGEAERVCEMPLGAFDVRWMPGGQSLVVGAMLLRGFLSVEQTAAERDRRADDLVKIHVTEDPVFRFWDHWLTGGERPHLFLVDVATGTARDLMPDSEDWFSFMEPAGSFDIHPDGSEIAYSSMHWDDDEGQLRSTVTRLDTASGERTRIAPVGQWNATTPRYGKCGRSIVYGATYERFFYADRVRLFFHDRQSGEEHPVLTGWEQSPEVWETEQDGGVLLLAGRAARTELFGIGENDEPTLLADGGTIASPKRLTDGRVVFTRQTLSHPTEIHVLEDGAVRRVTHFTDDALEGVAFGEVREVSLAGAEGETVQMWVVLPPNTSCDTPQPFVNVVHGGPHGTTADSFHPRWNAHLFASPGYVAAMPNFQGSTTWGQDFAQRIQGCWGDRPYGDVMACTDLMIESGLADPDRMSIAGGSYGGYLTSWVTSQTDRFACAVNHAGVFDTQGMFTSDVPQGRHVSLGGRPWDETSESLDRWNPCRHAAGINTPMLVIHGEKDYRVPVTQGLLCYSILRNRGVDARLVHFPDENHWILKPRNSLVWYREFHDWLARYLGRGEEANR
jgi:dipeptidyl aminopeptidase/acylaminoacyl peptidase